MDFLSFFLAWKTLEEWRKGMWYEGILMHVERL
jgi:hypothetical protein